jgi:hypothetical protein
MRAAGIFESSFNSKAKRRFEKSQVAAKGIVPAKSVYNLTYGINESKARSHYARAVTAFKIRDERNIVFNLREALRYDPWMAPAHMLKSQYEEKSGNYFEALSSYRLAIDLKKWNSIPYHKRKFSPDPLQVSHQVKWLFQPCGHIIEETDYDSIVKTFRKFTLSAILCLFMTLAVQSARNDNQPVLRRGSIIKTLVVYEKSEVSSEAELNLKLNRQDGTPASGLVSIVGSDTTINDNAYSSPKLYILKTVTGIEDTSGKELLLGGNPTNNGFTKLIFRNYETLDGKIIASNIMGNTLAQANLSSDSEISFDTKPGIILIQYINDNEKKVFKVVNNSQTFRMDFIQENGNFSGAIKTDQDKIKGAFSDDYAISYTDPSSNIENYTKNATINLGTKYSIDEILDWTLKEIKYSANTNTNTTIKLTKVSDGTVLEERTSANGIFGTKSLTNKFNNETGLQVKYELTAPYTDPATFTQTMFRNQEVILDTIRNGLYYLTITGNGTAYTVKSNGETITTKNMGEQAFFKKQGDQASLEVIVTRTGYITDTRGVNMNKGIYSLDIQLIPESAQTYSHVAHVTAQSSISGKIIKDGTPIYLVKAQGDTIWSAYTSGGANFSWTDINPTVSAKIGSKNVPGHNANEITKTIDDNENANITFTGLTYLLTQPIHIQNQSNENVSGATITGGDAPVTTNTSGIGTFTRTNLSTDINNLPLANYTTNISVSKTGIQTLNTDINSIAGVNPEVLLHITQGYTHIINGTTQSSISGKTIKNGTQIYTVRTIGDTLWTTTTNGTFSFSWTDQNATVSSKIGSKNVPGHNANEITKTIDDNENANITFTGLTYSFTHIVHVQNQYAENISSANISGGDAPVTTGTDGKATINKTNLPSDANNVAFANYTTNLTITKNNIQTLNTSITSVVGTNAESLKNVIQQYIYWLYGTATTPNGAAVAGTKDGTTIYNATVNAPNYETNHVTGITKTQTLNQVVFSAAGYTSQTFNNIVLNEGANKLEATLIAAQYQHVLNISALSSISGKTIKDGTQIYVIKDFTTTPGDTVWVTTTNRAASLTWNDNKQTLTTKIGSKNIPGHNPNSLSFTMDDNENRNITFTGLTYSFSHPVLVQNQTSENVANATISGGDAPVATNTNGAGIVSRTNIPTDINNLPFANYVTNLTITKNNIQTLNTTITSIVGTNSQTLKNVVQEYEHWLYGTSTTPSGALVRGWKDGTTVHSGTVSGTNYETNHIKRTTKTLTLDSLTFSMTGYVSQRIINPILSEGGNKVEATLSQIPQGTVHDFLIKPKTIHGDDISNLTLDFKWADGTITHYSVQPDGFIHVQRTENSNPTTTALVTHVTDTAIYSTWQFFRRPPELHNLADTNYAQNIKYNTEELPRPETPLKLENIPNTLYLYLGPTKVPTPETLIPTYGTYIRMDNRIVRGMLQRSPPAATAKFTPRPGAENVYVFQMTFNEYTGAPIDQTNLDRAKTELDKVLAIYTLNDGTKLMNYEFYTINSYTDPKWLESQARDNHDNMTRTTFDQSSPYNGIALTTTYSINGKSRINGSYSIYGIGNTNGPICAEIYQQLNNSSDPPEETTPWIYTTTEITEFGKTAARLIYFMNNGTTTYKTY